MKTINLDLTPSEKQQLKQKRVKINRLAEYAPDEISALLNTGKQRASEVAALIAFQSIPSVGPKFAHDLISLGYYSIDDLLDKDGPTLLNELERKQGFWTDPCVEDQFWLVVHYAKHRGSNKNWWDFTTDRKAYRTKHGYPNDRPVIAWHEQ
ncbi:helix-hairpin-helix domain-containing protein [Mucilaginibacter sp.]|uniref:helix-hairpin-helix domain-containing protein n=1 Tax=Mucilaginibacter sp. TaxID=1882438 RepID=UPI00284EF61E|nr:helix-hairpin-helix domain-containing protein [Mucilaginibacter sp.]MDR3694432.1 helix-hairpin-helix domain-containing protein [Mucilaginibacter sp.]